MSKTLSDLSSTDNINFGMISGDVGNTCKLASGIISSPSDLVGNVSNNTVSLTGAILSDSINTSVVCGVVHDVKRVSGSISLSNPKLVGTIMISDAYEKYNGPYVIIPKADEQIFETRSKAMRDDLIVKEIPYAEVSNPAGGVTVIIG